jgi:putative ABC transport system ATP-binding protein
MSAAPEAFILRLDRVSKTYPSPEGPLTVVNEISFDVRPGDTLSIVGPSGSGKTTLLGVCAGLDQPTSGSVSLDGRDLAPLSEDARARLRNRSVGFVFQNFQLVPSLTALENIMVPLELRGHPQARTKALKLLERTGLAGRASHFPAQLSGGEQQRVALARAFIHEPKILFADEPTGNLDAANSEMVMRLLFDLNHESGAALVLVTHNMELANRTRRILTLRAGALASDTPPENLQP